MSRPPTGSRMKPVLKYAYFADRNRFGVTTRSSAIFQRPWNGESVYALY